MQLQPGDIADGIQTLKYIAIGFGIFLLLWFLMTCFAATYLYHLRNDVRLMRSMMAEFLKAKVLPQESAGRLAELAQQASVTPPWYK